MNEQTYNTILDTAKKVLKNSRLPRWVKNDGVLEVDHVREVDGVCVVSRTREGNFLVDDIVTQALDAQKKNPARGKELISRVTRIARTIIHRQWYEARWNTNGKRLSRSLLRIVTPVLGEDGEWVSPLDTVGVDSWGKLVSFVPMYRGGSICGVRSTRKYANIAEDRMVEWLDEQRRYRAWWDKQRQLYREAIELLRQGDNAKFIIDYVANRRRGEPASSAERVRFHRLKKACNVCPCQTAIAT